MSCCSCCCHPGECCGPPGEKSCCKDPRVCCGTGPTQTCCFETEFCCGEGSAATCCPDGEVCCAEQGRCCPENHTCCGTEECCPPDTVCCDGICCLEGECCVDGYCVACDCDPPCTSDNCEECVEDPPGTFNCESTCAEGEYCCNGACQAEPCDCDHYQDWTLEVQFCGETLTYTQANGGFRLDFTKGATDGACCWFGTGDDCGAGNKYTGPNGGTICTGGAGSGGGGNCYSMTFELQKDEDPDSPTYGQCVGAIYILATGPSGDCGSLFCVRNYEAVIVNGELTNVATYSDGACGCADDIDVTLTYAP